MTKFALILTLVTLISCVRSTPDEIHIRELNARLAALISEETEIKERLKNTKDPGTSIALQEELLLHQSRMEHLRATIEVISPK
ncbi:MAG: hypothetical protein KDD39_05885 [Bdellovibrionales bacterium]|nr:hypothetical protein [Bdellovibrionales bacterium]